MAFAAGLTAGLMLAVLGTVLGPDLVSAQSERPVVVHYLTGPYEIGVLTQRSDLSVGRAVFTITVQDAEGGEPVGDARVVIRTSHQVEGTEGWASAFNSPNAPETYYAQVYLEEPGIWDVLIEIESPLGSSITSVGSLHIPNARTYSSGSYVFIGVFAVLLLGGGYLWWNTSRNQRRRAVAEADGSVTEDSPQGPGPGASPGPR